jgi:hypothetical protein
MEGSRPQRWRRGCSTRSDVGRTCLRRRAAGSGRVPAPELVGRRKEAR